ncbi:uncharacterized protein PHACADRAFT_57420, partial [Phanerochaete carnosa HHB-10118-sp]
LCGLPNESLLWRNMGAIQREEDSVPQNQWIQQYGHTIAYCRLFSMHRLWTMDTRVLNHIMVHHTIYQRPFPIRYMLSRAVGPGVLVTK